MMIINDIVYMSNGKMIREAYRDINKVLDKILNEKNILSLKVNI